MLRKKKDVLEEQIDIPLKQILTSLDEVETEEEYDKVRNQAKDFLDLKLRNKELETNKRLKNIDIGMRTLGIILALGVGYFEFFGIGYLNEITLLPKDVMKHIPDPKEIMKLAKDRS